MTVYGLPFDRSRIGGKIYFREMRASFAEFCRRKMRASFAYATCVQDLQRHMCDLNA